MDRRRQWVVGTLTSCLRHCLRTYAAWLSCRQHTYTNTAGGKKLKLPLSVSSCECSCLRLLLEFSAESPRSPALAVTRLTPSWDS